MCALDGKHMTKISQRRAHGKHSWLFRCPFASKQHCTARADCLPKENGFRQNWLLGTQHFQIQMCFLLQRDRSRMHKNVFSVFRGHFLGNNTYKNLSSAADLPKCITMLINIRNSSPVHIHRRPWRTTHAEDSKQTGQTIHPFIESNCRQFHISLLVSSRAPSTLITAPCSSFRCQK